MAETNCFTVEVSETATSDMTLKLLFFFLNIKRSVYDAFAEEAGTSGI